MSERKVLNKYYPPDFDPSKIPKGKRNKNATFNIRIMAPFNMRCNTCKEYIYKGKKFNSRKEDVVNEFYLGLRIFRFYIKCPRCVSEIAFKTDVENIDYTLEAGATRLFEAEKLARQMQEQEQKQLEEDELNPMKVLENRTKASIAEMDQIDSLEELREINSRKNIVNTEEMIEKYRRYEETLQQLQMEEEEKEIREIFGGEGSKIVKRLHDSDSDEDEPSAKKIVPSHKKPTDILSEDTKTEGKVEKKPEVWQRSVGSLSSKQKLSGLVVKKKTTLPTVAVASKSSETTGTSQLKTETSSNQRQDNSVHSEINTPANQSGCNSDTSAEVNNSTNQIEEKKGETSLAVFEADTKSEEGKSNTNSDSTSADSDKTAVSKQTSGSSGALGMLGAYSDSESDNSE